MNRLRALAERPVEDRVARALFVLALAVTVGMACLVGISGRGADDGRAASTARAPRPVAPARARPAVPRQRIAPGRSPRHRRQDAQDRPGTVAHRRAARELATHRALQHVPWHGDGVAISLVGTRGGRAVLSVAGPSIAIDRRAWRAFLRRYRDDGRSYIPRFRKEGGNRGR